MPIKANILDKIRKNPDLFEKMAGLYSERNRRRTNFAKIDNPKAIGKNDPEKFKKWLESAKNLEDVERAIQDEKIPRYKSIGFKPAYKGGSANTNSFVANRMVPITREEDRKLWSKAYDRYPEDDGYAEVKLSKIRNDYVNELIENSDTYPDRKMFEKIGRGIEKEYNNYLNRNWGDGHFHLNDINFKDDKGVEHSPMRYYYRTKNSNLPWNPGERYTSQELADLTNGL